MSIRDIATSSELKLVIFAGAAAAVAKGLWDYAKIVRHDNRTTKADELLASPNLVAARARSREAFIKAGIKTDVTP